MQKAYEAISTIYFNSALDAKSFNPTRVRVNGWKKYITSAGSITIDLKKITESVEYFELLK